MTARCGIWDILRHGECEGGAIFRGNTDVALSARGRRQMAGVCERQVQAWQRVFSSPLRRCAEFATELSERLNIPLQLDARLREMSFGDWEGREIDEVRINDAERLRAWSANPFGNTPPGGEPLASVLERVDAFLDDLAQQHAQDTVLIVSHGGVIRVALAHVLGLPAENIARVDVPYASLSRFAVWHAEAQLHRKLLGHNLGGDA